MNAKAYMYDVFISYTATDQAWVRRELLPRLAAAGLRYALSDQSGAVTPARLLDAEDRIRQSRRLIAVLSPAYLADGLAKFENLLAQTLDFTEMTFRVIPLRIAPIEPARLPSRLAMLATANLTVPEKYAAAFDEIVTVLRSPLPRME